jgi:hypothetical protein
MPAYPAPCPPVPSRSLPRRTFLQSVGAAAAWSTLPGRPLYGGAPDVAPAPSSEGAVPIAFWEPVDVLICGSTLFACQLALDAARGGLRTALMMERVNPLFEGVACLRAWVDAAEVADAPEAIRSVLRHAATSETLGGRTYFNASRAALDVEDLLCAAGVRFFYNAAVAGALGHEGRLAGAVFGGKTGLFAFEAGAVVDATLDATVARAAGAHFTAVSGPRRFHCVADLAKPAPARNLDYRAANGVEARVAVHHYYAEFDLRLESRATGPFAFADDYDRIYAATLECPWQGGEKRFRGADGCLTSGGDRLELAGAGRAAGVASPLVFGPHGIPGNSDGSLVLKSPRALFAAFPDALAQVRAALRPNASPRPRYEFWNRGLPAEAAPPAGAVHSFLDHGFDEPGTAAAAIRFQPPQTVLTTPVLVVGGGTSGNAAAYACASLGLPTVCLERGLELGGTNTVGGVVKLWFGNRTRAFEDYFRAMNAKNDGINAPGFFRGVRQAGARVLFQTAVTGVMRVGRDLRRVYVITPLGLAAIDATHLVDATGDGALAAWAGCGYTFGGEHDELTLWASYAGYRPGNPEALRPFLSPLDERSPLDLTRFILAMRRNSRMPLDSKHVPPPFFVAPRESRHIRGGRTVTFLDVLAGRRFRDGILRAESNPDIKGVATSDAAKSGFIPADWKRLLQVTVPYAALIPPALDNLIVAGKAYSVTHDALSTARMQRDLCVMGLVAGEALRLAVKRRVLLRDLPIRELQATLIAKGMLQAGDLADDDFGFGQSPAEIARQVIGAGDLDACLAPSAMLCLLPAAQVRPLLEPHAKPGDHAVNRVLSFIGSPRGLDHHVASVRESLSEPELRKELFGTKGTSHLMPDQGYAPWAALRLGSLAHARDPRAVPLLVRLAERVTYDPKDMRTSWGYFYSLACGFERLACAEGRAPLRHVLGQGLFRDVIVRRSADLRACRDVPAERLAYLRLAVARALTRCGDAAGAEALCDFLDEARVCYARAARAGLAAATGRDFGFRAEAWRDWLRANGATLKPQPLTTPFP